MADRITIDIAILQGIFGDLAKLQKQFGGIVGGMAGVDNAATRTLADMRANVGGATNAVNALDGSFDASMRNIVSDVMAPIAKTQELEQKLRTLGSQVRTSKSVGEVVKLKKEIAATQKELDGVNPGGMEQKVSGAAKRMRSMLGGLAAPIAGVFAVGAVKGFVGDMISAAGAQQQFGVAMNTIVGDKAKADKMIADVKAFAAQTPFDLEQTQKASTQMLGMGFSAESVIPALRQLGDVAAGLGQPMGDLAYLYATTRAQGKMNSTDLMQFANRGIPIIEELSKVLKTSQGNVKSMVESGSVNFGHLQQVFNNLTGEGGKFGGLMEGMNATISGQLGQLGDKWQAFKADLGEAFAPQITAVIGALDRGINKLRQGSEWFVGTALPWIKDNGDAIINVIKALGVATAIYGIQVLANNRAIIANNAVQLIASVRMKAQALWTALTVGPTVAATAAQWSWNAALLANPIGLVIAGVVALVAGVRYAWNNFEGFRSVVTGVWEVLKSAFRWVADFVRPAIDGIVEHFRLLREGLRRAWGSLAEGLGQLRAFAGRAWAVLVGLKDRVVGAFKGLADKILAPFREVFSKVKDIPGVSKLLGLADKAGNKVAAAFGRGQAKGQAAFKAAKEKRATAGMDATDVAAPGQNLGAADLVGGKGDKGKGDGVTVGGDGKGGGRTITMDIKITNNITLPRDANMGIRELADKVTAMMVNKLNDAQYAMG